MKHVHFIGIGGMGMGTLASLILAKGYKVSGSDLKESPLTVHLRAHGASIHIGHDAKNVEHPASIVYSSAITRDNPELQEARRKKIPIQKRARLLAQLVNAQTGITVAGAHGKTTTAAMIAQLLLNAGLDPTTMVGGMVKESSDHAHLGSGKYFVAEVDESDGSFLFFKPVFSVITNIDYEHLDYYRNWKNILKAYRQFIRQTKKGGCVFAYGEDPRLKKILSTEKIEVVTYGTKQNNDLRAAHIALNGYAASFDCFFKRKKLGVLQLNVPGGHNVLNALACAAVGWKLGIDFAVIQKSLKDYQGVERRFQLKADIGDILVVDDYGHHPTEIISTLKTARTFGKKRLITVFQPHRYSRTKYLWKEFAQSLALSDYLILTDIYAAGEKSIPGVTTEELLAEMKAARTMKDPSTPPPPRFLHSNYQKICKNAAGQEVGSLRVSPSKKTPQGLIYLKKEKICQHLLNEARPGDLIVFLGAGDITQVGEDFVEQLKKQCKPCVSKSF